MQVVLSQRMTKPFLASPLALYRTLRSLNPSPTCSTSISRIFISLAPRRRFWCGSKGTGHRPPYRRHPPARLSPEEDAALAAELLADEKERAEHPSCSTSGATIAAASPGRHRQAHREHDRRALLARDAHRFQRRRQIAAGARCTRRAARHFPGGYGVRRAQGAGDGNHRRTGAGQARHLRRSGRLSGLQWRHGSGHRHPHRRGQGRQLHVQAGAGIVADSDPNSAWTETQNKARAVLRAAELAEQGLDTRIE